MSKQQIHIKIDHTTYLMLKSKNINVSRLANDLFKQYLEFEEMQMPEEIELLNKIEANKKMIQETEQDLKKNTVMLTKLREDKEKEEKARNQVNESKGVFVQDRLRGMDLE